MSSIQELFGELSAYEIMDIFSGANKEFEVEYGTFDLESNRGWHIVKHKETGKIYGLPEYTLDSWSEGSISYERDEFEIHELEEKEVVVTQHISITSEELEAKWIRE